MKKQINEAYKKGDMCTVAKYMYNIGDCVCAKFKISKNKEEIRQELVFKCYTRTCNKKLDGNIFSYYYTVMCNAYRDIIRRRQMKNRVAPSQSLEWYLENNSI